MTAQVAEASPLEVVPPAFSDVLVRGTRVKSQVAGGILEGRASVSIDAIGEISFTIHDPDFELFRTGLFKRGGTVDYRTWRQEISRVNTSAGADGRGTVVLTCRARVVGALKKRRGPKVLRNASPSDFVREECRAVGAKYVVQDSPKRKTVARDVRRAGEGESEMAEPPSSWTTFQRFAGELGFIMFEAAGTIFFGKPSWLIRRDSQLAVVTWDTGNQATDAVSVPEFEDSSDSTDGVNVTFMVPPWRVDEFTPGERCRVRLPPYNQQNFIVRALEFSIAGDGFATVTAGTPVNPEVERGSGSNGEDDKPPPGDDGPGRPKVDSVFDGVAKKAGFTAEGARVAAAVALAATGGGSGSARYVDAAWVDRRLADERVVARVGMFALEALRNPEHAAGADTLRVLARMVGNPVYQAELLYTLTRGGTDWSMIAQWASGAWEQFADVDPATVTIINTADPDVPTPGWVDPTSDAGRRSALAFAYRCLQQIGDVYLRGVEVDRRTFDPAAFDGSELVEWAAAQVGCFMPDAMVDQLSYCRTKGTVISVEEARRVRGALLFGPDYVAVSLGDGRAVEAVNREYGVRELVGSEEPATRWQYGARVPGMRY